MPSRVFADLADVRLDKEHLSAPLDRNEEPDAMGSFGVVVKRVFSEVQEEESVCVIHGYFSVQLLVHFLCTVIDACKATTQEKNM